MILLAIVVLLTVLPYPFYLAYTTGMTLLNRKQEWDWGGGGEWYGRPGWRNPGKQNI
jgi:hypothetical protein